MGGRLGKDKIKRHKDSVYSFVPTSYLLKGAPLSVPHPAAPSDVNVLRHNKCYCSGVSFNFNYALH